MADWDSSSWAETRFSAEVLAASPASLVRLIHLTNELIAATTAVMTTMAAEIAVEAFPTDIERAFCAFSAIVVAAEYRVVLLDSLESRVAPN